MIKIKDKRYNPDKIREYYPHYSVDRPSIIIVWDIGEEESIVFDDEKERDMHINAMDEAMLIVKDGKIVERQLPLNLPFIIDEGGMGGMGGINLQ